MYTDVMLYNCPDIVSPISFVLYRDIYLGLYTRSVDGMDGGWCRGSIGGDRDQQGTTTKLERPTFWAAVHTHTLIPEHIHSLSP